MKADAIRLNDIVTMKRIVAGGSMATIIATAPIASVVQRASLTPRSCDTSRPVSGTYRFSTTSELASSRTESIVDIVAPSTAATRIPPKSGVHEQLHEGREREVGLRQVRGGARRMRSRSVSSRRR